MSETEIRDVSFNFGISIGICIGVMLSILIITFSGGWYSQAESEIYQEAVASGHAEWIIETNESGEPEMKFQWKQLK